MGQRDARINFALAKNEGECQLFVVHHDLFLQNLSNYCKSLIRRMVYLWKETKETNRKQ